VTPRGKARTMTGKGPRIERETTITFNEVEAEGKVNHLDGEIPSLSDR